MRDRAKTSDIPTMFNLLETAWSLLNATKEGGGLEDHEQITWDGAATRWMADYERFMDGEK